MAISCTALDAEPLTSSPEDIENEIRQAGHFAHFSDWDPGERWEVVRGQLDEKIHLNWSASYLTAVLGATGGGDHDMGASGELLCQGVWDPSHDWKRHPFELRYRFRHRHAYGGAAPSELAGEMGALWGVVNGFTDRGLEIPDFFLLHRFDRLGVEMRYGQMSIDSQFGGHQMASARMFFLNQAFASDPGVAFPRFGAGITATKDFEGGWSIGIGSTTIQGTQNGSQVDFELGSDDLFQVLQVAYEFKDGSQLANRLALLSWRSDAVEDAGQPGGRGVQLSYEKSLRHFNAQWFSTVSWAHGGANRLDGLVTTGLGMPCRDTDFLGAAVGLGQGADAHDATQAVFEGFYRWQGLENLQITPDIQLLCGERLRSRANLDFVVGLRILATF